ncbi:MAG: hypothetical protein AAB391_02680 [Patescibacteria group bacterium]
MKTIQNIASGIFIGAVSVLSLISILGVWDVFNKEVISKSFATLGILAVVAVVVMVAGRFVGGGEAVDPLNPPVPAVPNPTFRIVRIATLGALIVSAVLLAFLGVCSIWEIITDKAILYKSLSSLAVIAFSSFVIVLTCLERENSPLLKRGGRLSPGVIILCVILFMWMMMAMFSGF